MRAVLGSSCDIVSAEVSLSYGKGSPGPAWLSFYLRMPFYLRGPLCTGCSSCAGASRVEGALGYGNACSSFLLKSREQPLPPANPVWFPAEGTRLSQQHIYLFICLFVYLFIYLCGHVLIFLPLPLFMTPEIKTCDKTLATASPLSSTATTLCARGKPSPRNSYSKRPAPHSPCPLSSMAPAQAASRSSPCAKTPPPFGHHQGSTQSRAPLHLICFIHSVLHPSNPCLSDSQATMSCRTLQ